jgi:hypothetical protein
MGCFLKSLSLKAFMNKYLHVGTLILPQIVMKFLPTVSQGLGSPELSMSQENCTETAANLLLNGLQVLLRNYGMFINF